MEVTPADTYKVAVTAHSNLFEHMDIRKAGTTLIVGFKPGIGVNTGRSRATITMPELQRLDLSGAVNGTVGSFTSSKRLTVDVSGASRLDMATLEAGDARFDVSGASRVSGNLKADSIQLEVSGASRIEMGGSANDGTMEVSGASSVKMVDFKLSTVDIGASGASKVYITVAQKLDIDLSGASSLDYYGNPVIGRVSTTGASSINHR